MVSEYEMELEEFGDVVVEYETYPSYRGARDSYGAPLEPDEEGGFDIISVKFNGEEILDLLDRYQLEYIEREIENSFDFEPDYPDYD